MQYMSGFFQYKVSRACQTKSLAVMATKTYNSAEEIEDLRQLGSPQRKSVARLLQDKFSLHATLIQDLRDLLFSLTAQLSRQEDISKLIILVHLPHKVCAVPQSMLKEMSSPLLSISACPEHQKLAHGTATMPQKRQKLLILRTRQKNMDQK